MTCSSKTEAVSTLLAIYVCCSSSKSTGLHHRTGFACCSCVYQFLSKVCPLTSVMEWALLVDRICLPFMCVPVLQGVFIGFSLRIGFACHLCACQFFKVCSQVSALEQALRAIYVHASSSRCVHRFQS